MKIEDRPIADLRPYERNPRKIPKKAVSKVALSIKEFGWRQPIVVDETGSDALRHGKRIPWGGSNDGGAVGHKGQFRGDR